MRGGFQDWHGFEYNDAPFRTFVYHDDDLEPTRHAGYQTDVLTDLALEYMAQHDPSDPLFLTLSVEPPHFPCHAPESFRRFDPDSLETRPNFARLDPFFAEFEPELDEQTLRQILANYYAMVENLDWNIDRLTGRLAKLPGFENTLLVYISDHGDYVGCHGLGTTKINHHEESVRIPAIFHWPGEIPSRGQISGLFSLVDLLPTTLGLVNIPLPNWCQGTDFSPLLRGEPFTGPQEVLLEMVNAPRFKPRFQDWRGLVTERWKYAFYEDGRECLFDLETDPYELQDLASSTPEVRIQLRTRLLEMLDETREPFFDVIIEHGVVPPASNYIKDFEGWKNVVRRLGGLEPPDVDP
jgi:arylsulfatase A-like enzyme